MASTPPIILREKVYIPIKASVDKDALTQKLDKKFTVHLFNDAGCRGCDYKSVRPCSDCYECVNLQSATALYTFVTKKGKPYLGVHYPDTKEAAKLLPYVKKLPQKDLTPDSPMTGKLKFTGSLRPHQVEAVDAMLEQANNGYLRHVLLAPPRSGKTVLSIAFAIALGQRTLIATNQHDLNKQFFETCYGGEVQDSLTNAVKYKGKLVVLANKMEDYFKGDIVITTYQKFISELGKGRLKQIESLFGLLIIDEVHRAAAKGFLSFTAQMNTRHKLGLTATLGRKDGSDILVRRVLGPVIHKISVPTMVPELFFHETNLPIKREYSQWVTYLRWLENSSDREQMIIEQVKKDLKAKHSIVIPCYHTSQIFTLVRKINTMMGRKIAVAVTGGATKRDRELRDQAFDNARTGKIKVIVGTRKIVSTGVNVPVWSCLYWIDPINNPPNWIQEYSRILTPLEGKKPIIRFFLDHSTFTRNCFKGCMFKTEGDTKPLAKHAIISKEMWEIAGKYLTATVSTHKGNKEVATPKALAGRRSLFKERKLLRKNK